MSESHALPLSPPDHAEPARGGKFRRAIIKGSLGHQLAQYEANRDFSKKRPLPPPQTGAAKNVEPGTKEVWRAMGSQILLNSIPSPSSNHKSSGSTRHSSKSGRRGSRSSRRGADGSSKTHSNLTVNLDDSQNFSAIDQEMPARVSLVNKFAQEIMRSYPQDLAALIGTTSSPKHSDFVIDDLDTSMWLSKDDEDEISLSSSLQNIRASAAKSFEAFRRSKSNSPHSTRHGQTSTSTALHEEYKDMEVELVNALEKQLKGFREKNKRLEVKLSISQETAKTLQNQMKKMKGEFDQLKQIPSVAQARRRRDSFQASRSGDMEDLAAAAAASPRANIDEDPNAAKERIHDLEKKLAQMKQKDKANTKKKMELDVSKKKIEKHNKALLEDLHTEKIKSESQAREIKQQKELIQSTQQKLDDKQDEIDTLSDSFGQQRLALISEHTAKYNKLKKSMEAKLQEQFLMIERLKEKHGTVNDAQKSLVTQMGQMLKEAIEKSTKKSTQVEKDINNGVENDVDSKEMFQCVSCGYINASIRLVCHNCGVKRFATMRNEKERKHVRQQWVNSLVHMYLNMLDEILKTPRGEKVVLGEARHSSRSSGPITPQQVQQAEQKIQKMLQAAATQKGKQKFSEVYPKMDSSTSTGNSPHVQTSPKMKRHARNVVNATKTTAAMRPSQSRHNAASTIEPGTLVYAKWWGAEREKFPDWYEAVVDSVQGPNSYTIRYQNDQKCGHVPRSDIRTRSTRGTT